VTRVKPTIGRNLAARALALVDTEPVAAPRTGAIDLTRPAPSEPPPVAREAAKAALDRGETHYTSRPGVPELRRAIAERSTAGGFPATSESVVVTNGGSEALYIALQSVLTPGKRILLATPTAPNILAMIAFIGAEAVWLPAGSASRFVAHPDDVTTAEATALLLASPSIVTSAAIPPADLERLIAAADSRGMAVILDRSAAWCYYDPQQARFENAPLAERLLTTGSFSTAYAMAGWRAGYFTAPRAHIATMRELKQAMSICTSAVAQYAALAALTEPGDWLAARRANFTRVRDDIAGELRANGVDVVEPDAWPHLLIDARLLHPDDRQAAAMLAGQSGILVEPASRFGPSLAGFIRITLAAPEPDLRAGIQRLIDFHNTCL
jgi:aspartate aminotransferase